MSPVFAPQLGRRPCGLTSHDSSHANAAEEKVAYSVEMLTEPLRLKFQKSVTKPTVGQISALSVPGAPDILCVPKPTPMLTESTPMLTESTPMDCEQAEEASQEAATQAVDPDLPAAKRQKLNVDLDDMVQPSQSSLPKENSTSPSPGHIAKPVVLAIPSPACSPVSAGQ